MGRTRHTHRTNPDLRKDRNKVSFRLSDDFRSKVDAVAASGLIPEIHTPSDAYQDAVWLWLYEIEREHGKGIFDGAGTTGQVRDRVGEPSSGGGEEAYGSEVGEVSPAGEGSTWV